MSALSSFFSSFVGTAYAEEKPEENKKEEAEEDSGKEEGGEEEAKEEEEEEEPEDLMPAIRSECEESAACKPAKHHFLHCQEKIEAGEGHKGETCVEEMFLLMHCADNCLAPKLFSKLA
ncbi:Non-heme protein of cytochrome bc1 complex [Stereum hirsutum FP-91666 SS1]|uniref:Non-heme protein of cytochrome bc1 complex n=1 Tax=Stereum hirsutum (strain FP-91666) TaxID=721885 RepID=R7RVQ9_STEHR|nr:Non-heme protein of cytochrome bc1 complex [Stereum hirsutum FP-91666 SS1]EIM79246.1 Non-heme protein of cytochrome bc1 complex [Stereum hirsutum FP-91666 SS1]